MIKISLKLDYSLLKAQIDAELAKLNLVTPIQVETPEIELELSFAQAIENAKSYEELKAEADAMKQEALELAQSPEYQTLIEEIREDYIITHYDLELIPELTEQERIELQEATLRSQERIERIETEIAAGEREPGEVLRYFSSQDIMPETAEEYQHFLEKASELGLTELTYEGKFQDITAGMDFSFNAIMKSVGDQWLGFLGETGKNIGSVIGSITGGVIEGFKGITDLFTGLFKNWKLWLIIIGVVIIGVFVVYFSGKTYLKARIEKKVFNK